ncbi:membrane-bound lytic murein transglycosylase F [Tangfeifania diversioriginum]|uniref:Membrane-bound lytic murein transglycosylase F n=1 Tax=Tangfeifania diversioriginum TaxID=1168035 RepID=A0A1M6PIJ0_9BACT|nr:membrane-bound lytic murein transglycosylase F [Tangfeifania diversioriginum]
MSILSGCGPNSDKKRRNIDPTPETDVEILRKIKREGKLRALTTYSGTSYFLYRGQPMGFEYELLKRFADHLGVELEIVVSQNIDSLLNNLNSGEIDLVAHGITITSDRKEEVNFTDYLYLTHQVLVQRKPENWRRMGWSAVEKELVHDAIELIGDTVSVRENSSYFRRLKNLSREIGGEIHIDTLPGTLSTDRIIKMVVDGDIKYTVADDNIASINASYYHILDIDVPISFSQRVAWAVAPGSNELLDEINSWLSEMKDEVDYYVIYNKYFKNRRNFRQRVQSDFYSLTNNSISEYDELIKEYSDSIDWDWRLLASQIYQESRFEPRASSWAGAGGLMQIMPAMAEDLGVSDRSNPEQNIKGGTKFLKRLWDNFEEVEDSVQRIKFTLASYNCGYYHVLDARKLAEMNNLDPNRWDNNVEEMILELSYPDNYNKPEMKYGYVRGIEPYTYVEQIFERFDHYRQFIES